MPRPFSDEQKTEIRETLVTAARSCFLRYGMKKTTIDDLAEAAGIAKGSFYQFFSSKEDLYLELFLREIPKIVTRLVEASFDVAEDSQEALVLFMQEMVHEMDRNPIARIVLDDGSQARQILWNVDSSEVTQKLNAAYEPIIHWIVAAQHRGEIIEENPYQITYALGLIKMLALNANEIPKKMYEALFDLAPRLIADGLTPPEVRLRRLQEEAKGS